MHVYKQLNTNTPAAVCSKEDFLLFLHNLWKLSACLQSFEISCDKCRIKDKMELKLIKA